MFEHFRITSKSHPKLWALVKKAIPEYRKRSATVYHTENISLTGRYWDGGSLSEYIKLGIDGSVSSVPRRNDFPFTAPDPEIDLTDGTIYVETGTFCGKPRVANIWMFPSEDQ
jgi:hypothetical protein